VFSGREYELPDEYKKTGMNPIQIAQALFSGKITTPPS